MDTNSHRHPDFVATREAEGRQEFEVIIRGVPGIHLSHSEMSDAVYALVKAKAEALHGEHPYFDIEVSTVTFSMGRNQG